MMTQELWAKDITDKVIDLHARLTSAEIEAGVLRALVVGMAKELHISKDRFMELTANAVTASLEAKEAYEDADKQTTEIIEAMMRNQGDNNVH